jgi:hypothetical protein
MTTSRHTSLIAAEKQRDRIPSGYLIQFEGITNAELGSMARDDKIPQQWRVYCGWELDYREAAGIEIVYDAEADSMKRRRAT